MIETSTLDKEFGFISEAIGSRLVLATTSDTPEIEMEVILQTLEKNNGDKPRTAIELGIALKTLYNKLNQNAAHAEAG